MTDETTATAENALAALQMRTVFGLVQALLTAAADPKVAQITLAELKGQVGQVAVDRAALDADRATFAAYEAGVRTELAKEEARIAGEAKILSESKKTWIARIERVEEKINKLNEIEHGRVWETLPGSMTRKRETSVAEDAHFTEVPDAHFGAQLGDGEKYDAHAGTNGDAFPEQVTLTRGISIAAARTGSRARQSRHG